MPVAASVLTGAAPPETAATDAGVLVDASATGAPPASIAAPTMPVDNAAPTRAVCDLRVARPRRMALLFCVILCPGAAGCLAWYEPICDGEPVRKSASW
jgi:hypothetical protein